jgi:sigma-B regulation protein RsbU (phosphoserine phosphatase)
MLTEPDPARGVAKLNDLIYEVTSQADRFITLALLVLDPATHQITLVSGGHPSPVVYRPGGTSLPDAMPREVPGVPLGILEGFGFESCRYSLQPGETLVLYTDGVNESMNVRGDQFEREGMERALLGQGPAQPQALVDTLVRAVKLHAAGREPNDDITVVALGRTG